MGLQCQRNTHRDSMMQRTTRKKGPRTTVSRHNGNKVPCRQRKKSGRDHEDDHRRFSKLAILILYAFSLVCGSPRRPCHASTRSVPSAVLGLLFASYLPTARSFGRPVLLLSKRWSPSQTASRLTRLAPILKGHGGTSVPFASDASSPGKNFIDGARKGDLETVREYLKQWGAQEPTSGVYRTALKEATVWGHFNIVRELVKFGADINGPVEELRGMTPLHIAAQNGACDMLAKLIEMGADPDVRDNNSQTPLFHPDLWPRPEIYNMLLRAGANINARDKRGRTALHVTCRKTSVDPSLIRLRALLKHGADIDAEDEAKRTPLHQAVLNDDEEAVEVLIEVGCNVTARDSMQRTPLHYAAASDSGAGVYELLESGRVDLEAVTPEGFTPLVCAARGGGACYSLLRAGANVNATGFGGRQALHWASRHGHEHCVRYLLEAGADKDAKDDKKLTAKDLALNGAHWKISEMLS